MNPTPNNPESERHLIGLTLLEKHVPQGARDLGVNDFYTPQLREAWRAFLELDQDGQEIDHISAYAIMRRNSPSITDSFPVRELVNTTVGMVHGVNERIYVQNLKECALKRYLIKELNNQIGALETEPGAEVIRALKRKVDDLGGVSEVTGNFRSLADIIDQEVKPTIEDLGKSIHTKISTGFQAIDNVIGGGLALSDVLLIAGVPGSGKSALVLQMAANIARDGVPIAFLSGEMSNRENVMRLLTQVAKVSNLNSVTHLGETDRELVRQWADAIKTLPMFFDSKTYDLQTIGRSMRSMVENHGVKVLVIDYIQLLKLNRFEKHSRYERITETSQEVKRIAMELGVAVIEVAQFNREGAKSGTPGMHDLEGSSQLEKDTSLIFIIDRIEDSESVVLRIVKGRNTGLCELGGRYVGRLLTFDF